MGLKEIDYKCGKKYESKYITKNANSMYSAYPVMTWQPVHKV